MARKEEVIVVVVVIVVGRSVGRSFPVPDRVSAALDRRSADHLTRGQFTLPSKIRQAIISCEEAREGKEWEGEEARA